VGGGALADDAAGRRRGRAGGRRARRRGRCAAAALAAFGSPSEECAGARLSAARPAAGDPRAPELLQTAQDQFDAAGGYDADKRIANVLTGLGFKQSDWSKLCSEFSGGWQMRIALARLLLGPAGQDAASGASAGVLFLARPRPGPTRARSLCMSFARPRPLTQPRAARRTSRPTTWTGRRASGWARS
jgi:hypothetical protein